MTNACQEISSSFNESLTQLTKELDAMQLAQLCAFAFVIPQLYFCREYLNLEEKVAIQKCMQRLESGLLDKTLTIEKLDILLTEGDFFDSEEARLRLLPTPE